MTRNLAGNSLLCLGVLVWIVYFALTLAEVYDGPVTPFLIGHLLLVVPGAFLKGREWTRRLMDIFGRSEHK